MASKSKSVKSQKSKSESNVQGNEQNEQVITIETKKTEENKSNDDIDDDTFEEVKSNNEHKQTKNDDQDDDDDDDNVDYYWSDKDTDDDDDKGSLLLNYYKYNDSNTEYSTRLIERDSGSHPNVILKGHIHSYLYLYHAIIDTPWIKLFFYGFLLFFAFNIIFGSIFHLIDGVAWNGEKNKNVSWSDAFFFSLQSMDTIGFGALVPKGDGGNWLVFLMSYAAGIFWTAFTGIVFAKLSRPSRLKRQFKFSDVAVVNNVTTCFHPIFIDESSDSDDSDNGRTNKDMRWSEYGEYRADGEFPCLVFRFGDMRHASRICEGDFHLIFFRRSTRQTADKNDNYYEDYSMEEMDYDINRQNGRVRSLDTSTPLLSLPWIVVHRINKLSPLYKMKKTQLINQKTEIIAIVDGIDEATSDNFQSWWSYTTNEIYWNYQFKPMVQAIVKSNKQFLQIDYDRISMIQPVSKRMMTTIQKKNLKKTRKNKNKKNEKKRNKKQSKKKRNLIY